MALSCCLCVSLVLLDPLGPLGFCAVHPLAPGLEGDTFGFGEKGGEITHLKQFPKLAWKSAISTFVMLFKN